MFGVFAISAGSISEPFSSRAARLGLSSPGGVRPELAKTSSNSSTLSLGRLKQITTLHECRSNVCCPTRPDVVRKSERPNSSVCLVCLAPILTEHRAVAVGDCLPLHRQLHLDASLSLGVEDGHAHALLHARPEHGGRRHQVAPGAKRRGRKNKKRRGVETVKRGEEGKRGGEGEGTRGCLVRRELKWRKE